MTGITYNTLDTSRMDLSPRKPAPGKNEDKEEMKLVFYNPPGLTTKDSPVLEFSGAFA